MTVRILVKVSFMMVLEASAASVLMVSQRPLTTANALVTRYTYGPADRQMSANFHCPVIDHAIAMIDIKAAERIMPTNRPRMFFISSALRSRPSVMRETEFTSLSKNSRGWSRIRIMAFSRMLSTQRWPAYSSR